MLVYALLSETFPGPFPILAQMPPFLSHSPEPWGTLESWGTKGAGGGFLGTNTFPDLPLKMKPIRKQVL